MVNDPSILLADEPTGNLDSKTTVEIIQLFKELHEGGQTIIVVTHEEDVAGHAGRIVRLRDGRVISDHPTESDPIHQDWVSRMAEGRGSMAEVTEAEHELNHIADKNREQALIEEAKNKPRKRLFRSNKDNSIEIEIESTAESEAQP